MRRLLFAPFLALAFLALGLAAPATAATGCDSLVQDTTSGKVLGDLSQYEAPAQQLANQGIDVKIRAFQTTPAGGYNSYYKQQVAACSSWQDPGGQYPKGNLLLLTFSMDRQSYIFYGSNLESVLDSTVDGIRADDMNAAFKAGNFPAGITDTMKAVGQAVDAARHPKHDSVVVNKRSSTGMSALAWVLAVAAGLAVLIGLGMGGASLVRYRRRQKEAHLVAERAAFAAQDRADSLTAELDNRSNLVKPSVELLVPSLNDEDAAELKRLSGKLDDLSGQVTTKAAAILDHPEQYSMIGRRRRSTKDYQLIAAAHQAVGDLAEKAVDCAKKLEQLCSHRQEELDSAPAELASQQNRLAELRAGLSGLTDRGFQLDQAEQFGEIQSLLERAGVQIDAKHPGQALDELRSSQTLLEMIADTIESVPNEYDKLQGEYGRLKARLDTAATQISPTVAVWQQLSQDNSAYTAKLLDEGDLSELLATIRQNLDTAGSHLTKSVADWPVVDKSLAGADQALDDLAAGCQAIRDRLSEVDSLKQGLPERVQELSQRIHSAMNEAGTRKGAQQAFRQRLQRQLAKLSNIQQLDNVLAADGKLNTVRNAVKSIEDASKAEHERVLRREREERERREAEERRHRDMMTGAVGGYVAGSTFGGSSGFGGGGFGGSSGGGWGGGSGGSSGGGW